MKLNKPYGKAELFRTPSGKPGRDYFRRNARKGQYRLRKRVVEFPRKNQRL